MLPKKWWTNPKLIELYIEKAEKRCVFEAYKVIWHEKIQFYTRQGLLWADAQKKAAEFFLKNFITKNLVPSNIRWSGKDHQYDESCSCCSMFVKAGVIKTPGKLRYLGNHHVGLDGVCKEMYDENGEPYYDDVQFANYLDMYRCEVCGNEWTEGY